MTDKEKFEEEALAEFIEMAGIPKEKVDRYSRVNRIEFHDCGETYRLKNPGLAVIFNSRSSDGFLPVLYFPKKHSEPVLSHSEISGLIYVYFGEEKYEITKSAVEAVEAIKALEQESFINKSCVSEKVCEHDKNVVLDKIRAEIEQTTSRYSISRECGGMGQVEWSDRLIKESEVLKILDKYRAESEES